MFNGRWGAARELFFDTEPVQFDTIVAGLPIIVREPRAEAPRPAHPVVPGDVVPPWAKALDRAKRKPVGNDEPPSEEELDPDPVLVSESSDDEKEKRPPDERDELRGRMERYRAEWAAKWPPLDGWWQVGPRGAPSNLEKGKPLFDCVSCEATGAEVIFSAGAMACRPA